MYNVITQNQKNSQPLQIANSPSKSLRKSKVNSVVIAFWRKLRLCICVRVNLEFCSCWNTLRRTWPSIWSLKRWKGDLCLSILDRGRVLMSRRPVILSETWLSKSTTKLFRDWKYIMYYAFWSRWYENSKMFDKSDQFEHLTPYCNGQKGR